MNQFKRFCVLVLLVIVSLPTFPQLFINEFMARNKTGLTDNREKFCDWIEVYNAGTVAIDMAGYYFTDTIGEPGKSKIKSSHSDSTTIRPQGYLVFFADGRPGNGVRHLSFKLKKSGEQVALYKKVEQKYVLVDLIKFKSQFKDVSYGRVPDGNSKLYYIRTASPGSTNNNATTGKPAVKSKTSVKPTESE